MLSQRTGLIAGCWVLVASLFICPMARAQVPHLIRYQGQLVDSQGVPLEGPYALTFRLYDAQTGGTKVWEEVQPNVGLTGGHFSVLLGQVTPLTSMDWSRPCWLSVQVNGDPELAPRQYLTSVPLAIRAETAEIVKTSGLTDDANNLVPSGAIILWTGASCPSGYARVTALDGAMLKAGLSFTGPTAASASELPAHSHGVGAYAQTNHSHNLWTDANTSSPTSGNGITGSTYSATWKTVLIQSAGAGPITGTSASTGSATIATIVLCQKQ